jgi:hypothetical protein
MTSSGGSPHDHCACHPAILESVLPAAHPACQPVACYPHRCCCCCCSCCCPICPMLPLHRPAVHCSGHVQKTLPPVNWRWVEEGDGYVGRLQPPEQPLGVGLPSGLQCLVPYPYRTTTACAYLRPRPSMQEGPARDTHLRACRR